MKTISLFALIMLIIVVVVSLFGCSVAPDGIDGNFWYDANAVFNEIDDDTMEGELSVRDDVLNLKLLESRAQTPKEKMVVELITNMVELQKQVVNGESIAEYEALRNRYSNIMEVFIPEFKFVED